MIMLYSNGCPCCEVLKGALDLAGIPYDTVTDVELMLSMGMTRLPMLCADGKMMNYPTALQWLKERMNTHAQ